MDSPSLRLIVLPESYKLLGWLGWMIQHGSRSLTTIPAPSQQSPPTSTTDQRSVPTADGELLPNAREESEPDQRTEPTFTPEQKPQGKFDQMCEPATSMTVGVTVELDTEENLMDRESEVILPTLPTYEPYLHLVPSCMVSLSLISSSSDSSLSQILSITESSSPPVPAITECSLSPPALSLTKPASSPTPALLHTPPEPAIPSAPPLLAPFSPSAPPSAQPSIPDPLWGFRYPALPWKVDPWAAPRSSVPFTPSQPIDQSAPPWLLTPSAPPGTIRQAPSSRQLHLGQLSLCRRSVIATNFRVLGCTSSLHLYGSVGILLPSDSASVLSCTSIARVPRHPDPLRHLVSPALWLCLGLHFLWLHLHRSSPWCS